MHSMPKGRILTLRPSAFTWRSGAVLWLGGVVALTICAKTQAGGSCVTNQDCDQQTNFCRPGTCDLFGNCQYIHNDAQCRVPPFGDNLFCNGVNFCNAALNGGAGACDINPTNCLPPTPQCNETLDACVECLNNGHCTVSPRTKCKTSTGECVQCTADIDCNDGVFCNGQETCNLGSGLCQNGTPVSCPPGQFCSNSLLICVVCEHDGHCNDGLYCNGVETCNQSTHTCTAGTAVSCKTCNGGTTAGQPCLINADCGGGGTCTGPSSFCNESNDECVQCLTNAHCNDGKFCTSDSCIFNNCSNIPDPLQFCDNGQFCDGAETCNGSTGQCGAGANPNCAKTCFRGPTPGATCTTDAGCGKACDAGFRVGLSCATDGDCTGACEGGGNSGELCTNGSTCESGVCRTGLCIPGLCRGGCSEQSDACVQCAPDVAGSTSCDDGLFCDGTETCNAQRQCVAGTNVNCSSLDASPCAVGKCNETTDQCQRVATPGVPNGTPCDDGSVCTRVDYCQNSFCVENPGGANDPYRCVRMEWRPTTTQTVIVGQTVGVDLYLVAQNCNTASTHCTSTQHPVQGVSAILSWDQTRLQLKPSTVSDKNPLDPCDSGNSCFVCAGVCSGGTRNGLACDNVTTLCPGGLCNANPNTYNWSSSLFPNDCGIDGLNQPCAGFPSNDGNALYNAIPQLTCGANLARLPCATTAGLNVTKIKFKALSVPTGGTTQVSLLPCFGNNTKSTVTSGILPPTGYFSSDVTKSLGPAAVISILSCGTSADCVDGNPCTVDTCLSGTCRNDPMNCADVDPCTVDTCNNGTCVHTPINCGAGNRCYEAVCYPTCTTSANCNDNVDCTTNTCVAVPGDDICIFTPDDSACSTGLFCSAQVCDKLLGCIFDHACVSANGNPCDNPATCNETTDTCGGCFPPVVVASGSRYLKVTPAAAQGATPLAILVEGECSDASVSCMSRYVEPRCAGGANSGGLCTSNANCPKTCKGGLANGTSCTTDATCTGGGVCVGSCDMGVLGGQTPVYLPAASWGTIDVHATDLRPGTKYHVYSVCDISGTPVVSASARMKSYRWGDTDGDGDSDFADIAGIVSAFKNIYSPVYTYQSTNVGAVNGCGDPQANCLGQDCINFVDISFAVDAFKGIGYPCASSCP